MGDQETDRRDYESGNNQLVGDEYAAWGEDDSYIYTWLCEQLNLTLVSIELKDFWFNT